MEMKIVNVVCHACKQPHAEKVFFYFLNPYTNKYHSSVIHYCDVCSKIKDDAFKELWSKEEQIALIEMYEKKISYEEINNTINKKFNKNRTITKTEHGAKGGVVRRLEEIKSNKINWKEYTDDNLLIKNTIAMFSDKKQHYNRYFRNYGVRNDETKNH